MPDRRDDAHDGSDDAHDAPDNAHHAPQNAAHGAHPVRRYDPSEIELKWQELWERERTWEVSNEVRGGDRERSYVLEMLPYPSGEPHIGHLKNYALGDAIAHFRRRSGHLVLHPMGYDAFGLPAENNAIKTGVHPRDATAVDRGIPPLVPPLGDLDRLDRELGTHEPTYYRWTQWIFLQLFKRGLAYRKEAAVNWCPHDQTVLANEQVIDGRCERCGAPGRDRASSSSGSSASPTTPTALLDGLDTIDWPEHVKAMQRNWIGRSEGAEVMFRVRGARRSTTRSSRPGPTRCSARPSS